MPLCLLVRDVGRRETVNRAGGLSDETNILTVVFCFAVSLTAAFAGRETQTERGWQNDGIRMSVLPANVKPNLDGGGRTRHHTEGARVPIGLGRHGWASKHYTADPCPHPADDSLGAAWGGRSASGRQEGPKGDIKGQEPAWVQGTGSARFARLGTPSDPSRTAQKCICAGSPCEIARPKYRYHRRQQEPTCASPPARSCCCWQAGREDKGEP